jgi:hypothetical protein
VLTVKADGTKGPCYIDFDLHMCPVAELSHTQKEDVESKVATEFFPMSSLPEDARADTRAWDTGNKGTVALTGVQLSLP